jgi:hypothetical protein
VGSRSRADALSRGEREKQASAAALLQLLHQLAIFGVHGVYDALGKVPGQLLHQGHAFIRLQVRHHIAELLCRKYFQQFHTFL